MTNAVIARFDAIQKKAAGAVPLIVGGSQTIGLDCFVPRNDGRFGH